MVAQLDGPGRQTGTKKCRLDERFNPSLLEKGEEHLNVRPSLLPLPSRIHFYVFHVFRTMKIHYRYLPIFGRQKQGLMVLISGLDTQLTVTLKALPERKIVFSKFGRERVRRFNH